MRRIPGSRPEHEPGPAPCPHYCRAAVQYIKSDAANANVHISEYDTEFRDDVDVNGRGGLFGSSRQCNSLAGGAEQT
jgi:hypothetical protein